MILCTCREQTQRPQVDEQLGDLNDNDGEHLMQRRRANRITEKNTTEEASQSGKYPAFGLHAPNKSHFSTIQAHCKSPKQNGLGALSTLVGVRTIHSGCLRGLCPCYMQGVSVCMHQLVGGMPVCCVLKGCEQPLCTVCIAMSHCCPLTLGTRIPCLVSGSVAEGAVVGAYVCSCCVWVWVGGWVGGWVCNLCVASCMSKKAHSPKPCLQHRWRGGGFAC